MFTADNLASKSKLFASYFTLELPNPVYCLLHLLSHLLLKMQTIIKGLHCNIIQNANTQKVVSRQLILIKTQYFWEINPWTIQSRGEGLNVESFDNWGDYFSAWGNNWEQKKNTQTPDLHVNLDNKQVRHLRVMLHISSSIPCLLNWNFSSEDNPGK